MKNTQIYKYNIPAHGSVQILTEGSYFRILSASGPVEVDADTYGNIVVLAGQGVKDQPFKRLFLNDKSGAVNTVSLLVSDGSFVDDRITGEVSVIDGGKARTYSGAAFSGYVGCLAAPGLLAQVQLWNPSTTINLIVEQVQLSSMFNCLIVIRAHNAEFSLAGVQANAASKKINSADSIGQLFYSSSAAIVATGKYLGVSSLSAFQSQTFKISEPIVIPPMAGLCIYSDRVATDLFANFEFYEDPI